MHLASHWLEMHVGERMGQTPAGYCNVSSQTRHFKKYEIERTKKRKNHEYDIFTSCSLIDCRQPKRNHILCNHLLAGLYLTLEKEPNEVEQNWKQLQVGRIISFQFYNYLMFEKVIVYVSRAIFSVLKTITFRWHLTTLKRGGARLTKSVSSRWKLFARYPI